jgi:hypothetical protein
VKIHNVEQGSLEWMQARLGVLTASEFGEFMTTEFALRKGETPKTYMCKKLYERLTRKPLPMFSSKAMEQGSMMEPEAVPSFELDHDVDVQRVGFITSDCGRYGCSPDGLIGDDGGIEIKCPAPWTHIKYLTEGRLPADYVTQVHGSMFVTGRNWWWFYSYCRDLPPFALKVERDEESMAAIEKAIGGFLVEYDAAFKRLEREIQP